jgi:hypothetical protein
MRPAILFLLLMSALPAAAGDWMNLMPDASMKGWIRIPVPVIGGVDPRQQWKVDEAAGTITCTGTGGHEWLAYGKEFGDFELSVEWRYAPQEDNPRYNSGVGLRMSKGLDLWLQAQMGQTGAYLFGLNFANGSIERVNTQKELKENRVKPVGEWNLFEIIARGDTVILKVNGAVASEVKNVGYRKGLIGLEAEGFEVSFRNLKVRTLE